MGADLYLLSEFNKHYKLWEKRFHEAVAERDRLPDGSPERTAAQKDVSRCYDKMYSRGYFRDPYNGGNLLWRFGLSWWRDVVPMLDDKGRLSPERAAEFLKMMGVRGAEFQASLASLPRKERRYYEARFRELIRFLDNAISLGEPIECSL